MKKYLKFFILWATDKLEWENTHRKITQWETIKDEEWVDAGWTDVIFYRTEKNTGIKGAIAFHSSIKAPQPESTFSVDRKGNQKVSKHKVT